MLTMDLQILATPLKSQYFPTLCHALDLREITYKLLIALQGQHCPTFLCLPGITGGPHVVWQPFQVKG